MVTAEIELTEQQSEALNRLAKRQGSSVHALIEQAIQRMLDEDDYEERWRRATSVLGKYSSGLPDVGLRHDDYLAEDFA